MDSNNKITEAYSCLKRNGIEYCIKGTTDGSLFETNVLIVQDAFKDILKTEDCLLDEYVTNQYGYSCFTRNLFFYVDFDGSTQSCGSTGCCDYYPSGYFECY